MLAAVVAPICLKCCEFSDTGVGQGREACRSRMGDVHDGAIHVAAQKTPANLQGAPLCINGFVCEHVVIPLPSSFGPADRLGA